MALAVGGVATSLAASPSTTTTGPTTGSILTPGAITPALVLDPVVKALDEAFDHGRMGAFGSRDITISSISGSSVTLTTADGWTRTINVTGSVELTKGGQSITLSDLAVGDQVRVVQTRNEDGTFTVTGIVVVVPSVGGTVSDVSSTGFGGSPVGTARCGRSRSTPRPSTSTDAGPARSRT